MLVNVLKPLKFMLTFCYIVYLQPMKNVITAKICTKFKKKSFYHIQTDIQKNKLPRVNHGNC